MAAPLNHLATEPRGFAAPVGNGMVPEREWASNAPVAATNTGNCTVAVPSTALTVPRDVTQSRVAA